MANSRTSSSVKQPFDDVTGCPICSEVLTDPRSLPCIHSYCLKCLEGYRHGRKPGQTMPCPICATEFTIPSGDLGSLPRSNFIDKLVNIRQISLSMKQPSWCELCQAAGIKANKAESYCVDCQEKYCDACSNNHRLLKATRSHQLIDLDDKALHSSSVLISKSSQASCDKHEDQTLNVYCGDCKMAICVVCYIASHKKHDCSDIKEIIETLRQQVNTDLSCLGKCVGALQLLSASIASDKKSFAKQVAEAEKQIITTTGELTELLQTHKQTLIAELATKKRNVIKKLDSLTDTIGQRISLISGVQKYCKELATRGADIDIVQEAENVHNRVGELSNYAGIENSRNDVFVIKAKFTPSTLASNNPATNYIGLIDIDVGQKVKHLIMKHAIECGNHSRFRQTNNGQQVGIEVCNDTVQGQVTAMTTMGDELFVYVQDIPQQIAVYDTNKFYLKRNIAWCGLQQCYGLAACVNRSPNCLFVSDYNCRSIHRYDILKDDDSRDEGHANSMWSRGRPIVRRPGSSRNGGSWRVSQYPTALCTTNHVNVLVALHNYQLEEYSENGQRIRNINLQTIGMSQPWCVIQLSTGQYAASDHSRIIVTDDRGNLLRDSRNLEVLRMRQLILTGKLNPNIGIETHAIPAGLARMSANADIELTTAAGLAAVSNGCILVADPGSNRVLVMDSTLSCVRELSLSVHDGLQGPNVLSYDETHGRLYVGENRSCRVLVFDNVFDVKATE